MPDDVAEPIPCCSIPMEQALAVIARLEVAAQISKRMGEALESERAQRERLQSALAELVGEEEAAQIAEGEEDLSLAPAASSGRMPSQSDGLSEVLAEVLTPLAGVSKALPL